MYDLSSILIRIFFNFPVLKPYEMYGLSNNIQFLNVLTHVLETYEMYDTSNTVISPTGKRRKKRKEVFK